MPGSRRAGKRHRQLRAALRRQRQISNSDNGLSQVEKDNPINVPDNQRIVVELFDQLPASDSVEAPISRRTFEFIGWPEPLVEIKLHPASTSTTDIPEGDPRRPEYEEKAQENQQN